VRDAVETLRVELITMIEKEVGDLKRRVSALNKVLATAEPETMPLIAEQLNAAHRRLRERQAEADRLARPAGPPPPPPTREEVIAAFADLPELLRGDVRGAAPVLRELTGPVTVTQEPRPARKKPAWFGSFRLDGTAMYLELTRRGQSPNPGSLVCPLPRTWSSTQVFLRLDR